MVSRKHCYECANYLTEFSKKFWWITVSKTARAASVLFWWLLAVGRTVNLLYFSSLRSMQQWSLTSSVIGQQFLETFIRSGGQGYFGISQITYLFNMSTAYICILIDTETAWLVYLQEGSNMRTLTLHRFYLPHKCIVLLSIGWVHTCMCTHSNTMLCVLITIR